MCCNSLYTHTVSEGMKTVSAWQLTRVENLLHIAAPVFWKLGDAETLASPLYVNFINTVQIIFRNLFKVFFFKTQNKLSPKLH
jgi:hypothetical protein